jgi:hypothetical protein
MTEPVPPSEVAFGPCCFCGALIPETATDPCRVTVETTTGKWQVWSCHGECFKARLASGWDFEPAHF